MNTLDNPLLIAGWLIVVALLVVLVIQSFRLAGNEDDAELGRKVRMLQAKDWTAARSIDRQMLDLIGPRRPDIYPGSSVKDWESTMAGKAKGQS